MVFETSCTAPSEVTKTVGEMHFNGKTSTAKLEMTSASAEESINIKSTLVGNGKYIGACDKGGAMIVEVVPYRLEWRKDFEIEKEVLIKYLGGHISEIHHIGSTSVIGLAAKPIIDIILEVPSLIKLDSELNVFQVLGYEAMGEFGIRGRRYYRKGGGNRTHQIHAFEVGDANIDRHIAFRDYLAAHPAVRLEYQDLKIQLAKECENDIDQYCTGKDSFVKHHEAKALQWVAKV